MRSALLPRLKTRLDELLVDIDHLDAEYDTDQLAQIELALANFRAANSGMLDAATPHLWAYYKDTVNEYGPELAAEYGVPLLDPATDIWSHVSIEMAPSVVLGSSQFSPAPVYLSFEGEVSWEPEHGLQLVVEQGLRVCKVGPFDGHPTLAHAHGDPSLLAAIYRR